MSDTPQKQPKLCSLTSTPSDDGDTSKMASQREYPRNNSKSSSYNASAVPAVLEALSKDHLIFNDKHRVDFADGSPTHPRLWSLRRKLSDSAIICLLEFVTTMISNAGSNIAEPAARHMDVSTDISIFSLVTLYMLGQAIGGLVFPPVTEVIGSKFIYISSTAVYGGLCFMIGFAPNLPVIVLGRFLCGLLSAMPTCVAIGSLENMWDSRARIWAIALWAAAGILAMAVGPLFAVYVRESSLGW